MGRRKAPLFVPRPAVPRTPAPQPKPFEYQLVDLLGEEGIDQSEVEAIRTVLMFAAARRRAREDASKDAELEATRLELGEHVAVEERYAEALRCISGGDGQSAKIAAEALYGDR